MKLYVIMGNDFPSGVMDDEAKAAAFCTNRMDAQRDPQHPHVSPRIYWRYYEFELNKVE